jgi:predicted metal-dependent hydrolase
VGSQRRLTAERDVEVRRSDRRHRTVSARVRDGKLVVYVPARLNAAEEAHWVARMSARYEARDRRRRLNAGGGLERRAKELNRRFFDGKLEWSSLVYVTNQSSRFGSCSPADGSIRISAEVAEMPQFVLDYVIVHELAHLVEPNHSEAFWELVNRYPLSERARGYLLAKGMEEAG